MTDTPNYGLSRPLFDDRFWHDRINANMTVIDATLAKFIGTYNIVGVWENSTAYAVDEVIVDQVSGLLYECEVAHTSAATPTTFAADLLAHPTYWTLFSLPAKARGTWTASTVYEVGDFVVSGAIYAVCVIAHTSGSVFLTDSANWSYLIDARSLLNSSVLIVDTVNNRVGIGTETPEQILHIYTDATSIILNESHTTTTSDQLLRNKNDAGATFDFRLNGSASAAAQEGQIVHSGNQPISFWQTGTRRMTIAAGGNVGIGTASPATLLDVAGTATVTTLKAGGTASSASTAAVQVVSTDGTLTSVSVERLSNGAAGGTFTLSHSRSIVADAFVTLQTTDQLGEMRFRGDDGTSYVTGAQFQARVDGSVSTGFVPSRFMWSLATASATVAEMMRLSSLNNLLIGGTVEAASAVKSLHLFNGTAPSAGAADGAVMYSADISSSGVMHIMNESGDIIILDQQAALTAASGGSPNSGDATTDTIISNLVTRVGELDTKLTAMGILA